MSSDASADLSLFRAEINLQHHQFIGVGMGLGGFNGRDFQFDLLKIIDGYGRANFKVSITAKISDLERQKKYSLY
jgi:hypothetical protein